MGVDVLGGVEAAVYAGAIADGPGLQRGKHERPHWASATAAAQGDPNVQSVADKPGMPTLRMSANDEVIE
jgi:hypothetical protein